MAVSPLGKRRKAWLYWLSAKGWVSLLQGAYPVVDTGIEGISSSRRRGGFIADFVIFNS
jgi:hypothetical protein